MASKLDAYEKILSKQKYLAGDVRVLHSSSCLSFSDSPGKPTDADDRGSVPPPMALRAHRGTHTIRAQNVVGRNLITANKSPESEPGPHPEPPERRKVVADTVYDVDIY